jgi:hypothetical protein
MVLKRATVRAHYLAEDCTLTADGTVSVFAETFLFCESA